MTYLGSKVKYSKYIVPILQKTIDKNNIKTFIDCCVGGANIIKNIKAEKRIAIDNNKYLIALYNEVLKENFEFPSKPTRADWDNCKSGNERDWYIGLTSIFSSYNTRGFAGGFIHGDIGERQYNGRINTFKKDLPLLEGIDFICEDYSYLKNYSNCCIYIDPPYKNTKKYDSSKNFNYKDFWQVVRETSKNNFVFVSEMEAPNDFNIIWELDTNRQLGGVTTNCIERLYQYKGE